MNARQLTVAIMALLLFYTITISAECDSIVTKGGFYYCGETKLSKGSDIEAILSSCPIARDRYSSAKGIGTGGSLLAVVGGVCLGWNVGNILFPTTGPIPALWVVGGICGTGGLTLGVVAAQKQQKAINTFNSRNCSNNESSKIDLKFTGNAIVLCTGF